MLVTLPFMLLLLDYWPLQRGESRWEIADGKIALSGVERGGVRAGGLDATEHGSYGGAAVAAFSSGKRVPFLMSHIWENCFGPLDLAVFYPLSGLDSNMAGGRGGCGAWGYFMGGDFGE